MNQWLNFLTGVLAVKTRPGQCGHHPSSALPDCGLLHMSLPFGLGVSSGPCASVILHVYESLPILAVVYLVLIRQKTSREHGQQVCQDETDEFLKKSKD